MFRDEWCRIAQQGLPVPLFENLKDSVYYPASGTDGDPVKHLGKQFQSFVYADYGVGRDTVVQELTDFTGYELEASRELQQSDLIPSGWNSPPFARMHSVPDVVTQRIREHFAI